MVPTETPQPNTRLVEGSNRVVGQQCVEHQAEVEEVAVQRSA
jgi:hypothetical protein